MVASISVDVDIESRRYKEVRMSRVQLAMNVDDLEEAVAFYSKLFEAAPHKRRPGYANFALEQPALKLVLIENRGQGGSLNHLGVEVASTAEVTAATARLADEGLATRVEDEVTCCYAVQDKVWVTDPNGAPWEIYTVLDDDPEVTSEAASADGCCGGNASDPCCT
jgi:catechol 2,3-dioxygenase-like lactoylglutathione lyase family enzyme